MTARWHGSQNTETITPRIKKVSLDQNIMKNYRPRSNLSFISKIPEKVVSSQLCHHLASNNYLEPTCMQSAYSKHHSIETTLLAVQNYLAMAIDQKKAVVLVLLDISAFYTTDHNILF